MTISCPQAARRSELSTAVAVPALPGHRPGADSAHGCRRPAARLHRPAARGRGAATRRGGRRGAGRGPRPECCAEGVARRAGGARRRGRSTGPGRRTTSEAATRARRVPAADDAVFREALGVGAETVAGLPESESWLVEMLTDIGDGAAAPGVTIGVIGGSGGAGATVFAAALAGLASATGPTLLLDADPLGAGIDRVLGLESAAGIRWDAMAQTTR